ncbi:hypothetical protein [Legionella donaldsonii]|uniref:hypothetical protein n=1 Tax=Legionella donaldsonii TaxID=45060 RepID=UPI000E1B5AFE|nr:hypothetical protein [Legionella donaldsonii]
MLPIFAKGLSLSEQASSEYSHGQQLQKAASHASDHAQSIDMNLNQPYHDWVVAHHGARGEQVMLQTDMASIQTQQRWAEDFLNPARVKRPSVRRFIQPLQQQKRIFVKTMNVKRKLYTINHFKQYFMITRIKSIKKQTEKALF